MNQSTWSGVVGITCMFFSVVLNSISNIFVKISMNENPNITVLEIIMTKNLFQSLFSMIVIYAVGVKVIEPVSKEFGLLSRRFILGYIGSMMFYYSFHYLPLGITQTMSNLTPFITLILAFLINGETVRTSEILNVIISFTGVVIIILSSSKSNNIMQTNVSDLMFGVAIFMSFAAAVTASLSVVMVR